MAINHTKTCPDCGASNNADDLFCKDCGASLAGVGIAAEPTNAFTPAAQPIADTQTTAVAPAVAPQPAQSYQDYSYPASEQPVSYGSMPVQESARGAVLGWLAATLFLVIVGFYLWSSVLSDATRDRFTGWF